MTKRCNRCEVVKPAKDFYRQADVNDGLTAGCKDCRKAYQRAYRETNSEHARAVVRAWHARNPDYMKAYTPEWRRQRPEWVREHTRIWNSTRKARKLAAFVEHVDPLVVLERGDGMCGICGEDVDPFAFHVDHIAPLAGGGEHSYANSQPAHPFCNLSKHTKSMEALSVGH